MIEMIEMINKLPRWVKILTVILIVAALVAVAVVIALVFDPDLPDEIREAFMLAYNGSSVADDSVSPAFAPN